MGKGKKKKEVIFAKDVNRIRLMRGLMEKATLSICVKSSKVMAFIKNRIELLYIKECNA